MIVTTVTVSSKGQFTIPKDIRHLLGMQPGDKVEL
jgi:AbrB family looped-hinge helix DNA binding protein